MSTKKQLKAQVTARTKDVVRAYLKSNGNVSSVSRETGLSRRTIYDHLCKAGYYEYRLVSPAKVQFRRIMAKAKVQKFSSQWQRLASEPLDVSEEEPEPPQQ